MSDQIDTQKLTSELTNASETPETQEAVERWRQGKINIFDEMARLERERDKERKVSEKRRTLLIYFMEAVEKLENELNEAQADRDEWIARFRADEQLIKEAMIPHPENSEP